MKRTILAVAIVSIGCIHHAPTIPPTPSPTVTPTPIATPTPQSQRPPTIIYYREGGDVDQSQCARQGPDKYHVAMCDNGYRPIAKISTGHMHSDCYGQDSTPASQLSCLALYVSTIEGEFPGRPWALSFPRDADITGQWEVFGFLKDPKRTAVIMGWDEYCDETATELVISDHVNGYKAEAMAHLGRTFPVVGTLGPDAVIGGWCTGWKQCDILAMEFYPRKDEDVEPLKAKIRQVKTMMPSGQELAIVPQMYSGNHSITDKRAMARYAAEGVMLAQELGVRLLIPFSGWRESGTMWEWDTLGPIAQWILDCFGAGKSCSNPPLPEAPPAATPEPTPLPSAPGVVWTERSTVTYEPGPNVVPWQALYLKDRGTKAPAASIRWHAACQTPGADCPDLDGATSWPAGGGPLAQSSIVLAGLPVEAQCCTRTWHWQVDVASATGGIAINDDRGNIQARTALPGVSWLESVGQKGENATSGWLVRGGDCSCELTVYLHQDAGTLTDVGYDGTDYGADTPIVAGPITMAASECQHPVSQHWQGGAIKGHAGSLTITGSSPAVSIGRVPTIRLEVLQ
jgi:hypothetical protein